MFRKEGARGVRRYVVAMLGLLLAVGLFANAVLAGVATNSADGKAMVTILQSQPAGKEQPFDCARIHDLGIDKQMNFHAMEIMEACSGRKAQSATDKLNINTFNSLAKSNPSVYGGADADVIPPEGSYPHVTQSETMVWGHGSTIVINYNDSRAASTCYAGYSYSTDGGVSWTRPGGTGLSPICAGHGTNFGDPIVVYNEHLSRWFLGDLATGCGGQGVGLWTSTDGVTLTPGACAHLGTQDDRESMWVDNTPSSPYYGRMYVSWNDFAMGGGALRVAYSDDGITWGTRANVTSNFIRDLQITGGPDGTVFIATMDEGGGGSATRQNIMQRSTNGGDTWQAITMGSRFPPPGVAIGGYFMLMFPTIWRYMGWGQPAVGPDQVVHYVYTQHGPGSIATPPPGSDPADMMYTRSTDNGSTWSTPMQLNTDTTSGRPNWQGSLAATSVGYLLASWYDGREVASCATPGVNTPCYRRYGRLSQDNGVTWQPDEMIGDTMSPLPAQPDMAVQTVYEGDYDYSSANGQVIYTAWNDGRTLINGISQQDVYFDKVVGGPTLTPTPTPGCAPNCTVTPTFTRARTSTPTPTVCDAYAPGPAVSATIVPGTNDTSNHCFECVTNINLPFPVRLYDNQEYLRANVSSSGNLQFVTSNTAFINRCLPYNTIAGPTIFPFWENLRTDAVGSCSSGLCGIFTSVSGNAPNRVFNVEWRAAYYVNSAWFANFEIRLYEGTPDFDIILGNITGPTDHVTIGVQDGAARFTQIVCNLDASPYLNKRIPMTLIGCGITFTPTRTPTLGSPTATSTPTCGPAWRVVDSPSSGILYGVSSVSNNDAWAVGVTNSRPLVEHWNGVQWGVVTVPTVTATLYGVATVSANDAWAVGSAGVIANSQTFVLHWDGVNWARVPSPNVGAADNVLYGVAAVSANDIWAVGYSSERGASTTQSLILHWDGAHWSVVPSPNPYTSNILRAVAVVAPNDIWAVGAAQMCLCYRQPPIFHWDGTQWSVVPAPTYAIPALYAVTALSDNDVWAVGASSNDVVPYDTPIIVHWDGTAWRNVPNPHPFATLSRLQGIAAVSTNDIWAVGTYRDQWSDPDRSLLEHWDGSQWSLVPDPNVSTQDDDLLGAAATSTGDIWAVGTVNNGQQTLVERYNDPCVTASPTATPTYTVTPCPMDFSDVSPDDYFYEAVRYLYCAGVITGYGDGTFRPYNNATRGQICKIVVLADGWQVSCPDSGHFSDVLPGSGFYCYVETAYERGVITGYSDGTFRPYNSITRGQLCKIVVQAEQWPIDTSGGPHFTDVYINDPFYVPIETAYNHGVITGYSDGTFRPYNSAARGQISKIIYDAISQP